MLDAISEHISDDISSVRTDKGITTLLLKNNTSGVYRSNFQHFRSIVDGWRNRKR